MCAHTSESVNACSAPRAKRSREIFTDLQSHKQKEITVFTVAVKPGTGLYYDSLMQKNDVSNPFVIRYLKGVCKHHFVNFIRLFSHDIDDIFLKVGVLYPFQYTE